MKINGIEVDLKKFRMSEKGEAGFGVRYEGSGILLSPQSYVCTARFIENLTNVTKEDLDFWVELLKSPNIYYHTENESFIDEGVGSFVRDIFYKPQMLMAVTTSNQTQANEVLEAYGFQRSVGVRNKKYGGELYNWTYEIDGWG